jgi:hypothetical protein
MADYYPSIAQAVNGLHVNTVETRRSIYDRARAAMLTQLRGLAPALGEAAIDRELSSLEKAIGKTEAENLRRSRPVPRQPVPEPEPSPPIRHFDPPAPIEDADEPEPGFPRGPLPNSMTRPQLPRSGALGAPRGPVLPRGAVMPRGPMKAATSPGHVHKLAVLSIVGLVVFAAATTIGMFMGPEIIAALRGLQNIGESTEILAQGNGSILPKIADRIGFAPAALPNANINPLAGQKVMLYEEDAAEPTGRSFGGSADWHTENVAPGAGLSPAVALRADIEIPEQRIGVRWTLRSNDDGAMPASHTMEIVFSLPPDFSHGGISRIPAVLMKQAEAAPGVPLAGLGVKVTPNMFLISLSSAEADAQRNVQLLKEQPWLDIPIVYDDGRRAILAVEKGNAGDRAFSDAFAAWEVASR